MKRVGKVMSMIVWVMILMSNVNGRLINVGGKNGWKQGVNYTLWTSLETFYVDEWLMFRFDNKYYDVLEVNKSSYENCNANGFIRNVTRGGRDVFELKEAKTYYFICSKGYCWGGMKLAVNVTNAPVPAPAPAPSPPAQGNSSASSLLSLWHVLVIVILALAFLIII